MWEKHPTPPLSSALVEDVIQQIQGLADALDTLHHCGGPDEDADSSWRHGDIKPQNILSRSRPNISKSAHQLDIGHLLMSDLGLAKRHDVATQVRNDRTSTRETTWRYSSPEIHTLEKDKSTARSRRYDIWSMGCVILEFAIWLLYGWRSLKDFNSRITSWQWKDECPWFEPGEGGTAKLHGVVEHTINFILNYDPECKGRTALRDLVELVRDNLLIVELGSQNPCKGLRVSVVALVVLPLTQEYRNRNLCLFSGLTTGMLRLFTSQRRTSWISTVTRKYARSPMMSTRH